MSAADIYLRKERVLLKKTPDESKLTDAVVDLNDEALTDEQMASRVDEVMKKFDRESNGRLWEGAPKWIVMAHDP